NVDAICHVVRCFEDDNIVHVEGRVSPVADMATINTELLLRDMQSLESRRDRARKQSKGGDPEEKRMLELCDRVLAGMEKEIPARMMELGEEDLRLLKPLDLITTKPVLYVANVAEENAADG